MGCCSSTTRKSVAERNHPQHNKQIRTPLPNPLFEEESVKEVLLETPAIVVPKKPTNNCQYQSFEPIKIKPPFSKNLTISDEKDEIFKKPTLILHPEELSEDASSEVCSTKSDCPVLPAAKKNEETSAVIRRNSPSKLLERSFSGDIARPRKSPVKKSNQSPNRSRPGTGPGPGPRKDVHGFGPNVQKKDIGEISGRRSLSPANRSGGLGAKPPSLGRVGSDSRNGKSPRRVKSEVGEKIRKLDNMSRSNRENKRRPTNHELSESPFVSLECFIFL